MASSKFTSHFLALVSKHWHIKGSVKTLAGYEDFNFYFESDQGRSFLIKISKSAFNEDLNFLNHALKFIEDCNEGKFVEIPQIIPTNSSKDYVEFEFENSIYTLRLHSWVPGKLWVDYHPKSSNLLQDLGLKAGRLMNLLSSFQYEKKGRDSFEWDLANAVWVENHLELLSEKTRRIISKFIISYKKLQAIYKDLRKAYIHNDINDYNILVHEGKVSGFIDFGDMCYSQRINDLAILLAYGMMFHNDPLDAAYDIIKGYAKEIDLSDNEIKCLLTLSGMRLAVSVVSAAINLKKNPENEYLQVTSAPAIELLEKLDRTSFQFAEYKFRLATGKPILDKTQYFYKWVSENNNQWSKVCDFEIGSEDYHLLDLGIGSQELGHELVFNDPVQHEASINRILLEKSKRFAIGQYDEIRPLYSSEDYATKGNNGHRWRTVHVGLDFFDKAGSPVYAFYDGIVESFQYNEGDKDYGWTLILKHETPILTFYTLYGHLSHDHEGLVQRNQKIKKGDLIAHFGGPLENGNWAPHLHFQIILDMLDYQGDFPGVCYIHEREIFKSISPDPRPFFGIKAHREQLLDKEEILAKRKKLLGRSYSISYKQHLHIKRAYNQYLYDESGRKFLDCVNNVPHVGHQNLRVIQAAQKQAVLLNTNTRYLHENIVKLAESLTAILPDKLQVCHFVNSGSEANELAVRMARAYTARNDIIVMEHGYHGNTNLNIDMSSYKFDGKGGQGQKDYVHTIQMPEPFRGKYRGEGCGSSYANDAINQIQKISEEKPIPAAFICESILSCGGQLCFPDSYLERVYENFQSKGIVIIADEVQTGLGRTGEHMWAFQGENVIPDIVTIGKPFGNGHPLGAVVCTVKIADAFANGMEYFNTFGGNPVSCAIGQEVINIVQEDRLMDHAFELGNYIKSKLELLRRQHKIIGDVRGRGFFLGWEFILDESWTPAEKQASYFTNRMKEMGVLLSTDGPLHNVIKFKPPMIFTKDNVDYMLECAAIILQEDFMQISKR